MTETTTLETFLSSRREARLVRFLEGEEGLAGKYRKLVDHPRVANLAGMLRRHGLVQTRLFLKGKGGDDHELMELLARCTEEMTDNRFPRNESEMAGNPVRTLFLQAQAIEAAVWIQRVAAARKELTGVSSGDLHDADQAEAGGKDNG